MMESVVGIRLGVIAAGFMANPPRKNLQAFFINHCPGACQAFF
jgi:hypothetical protein